MNLGLKDKRAIVLAASRGLGYACALGLAREGCRVLMCSRDQAKIDAAAAAVRTETGAEVVAVAADVSREADVRAVVARAVESFGGVEIAVHNAGGPPAGGFSGVSNEQWQRAFDQNLMSLVWLCQAGLPEMKKAGFGRIIAITSSSIKVPIPDLILSNVMRAGVTALLKTLAKEVAKDNILVNVVGPGRIATERIGELDHVVAKRTGKTVEEVRAASVAAIPMGRLGEPEELANLVVFLASEAASYVSGTSTVVDGAKLEALL